MNDDKKFVIGTKVHKEFHGENMNLIIAHQLNDEMWVCINPNLNMNENRCAIFQCWEDELEIGWI